MLTSMFAIGVMLAIAPLAPAHAEHEAQAAATQAYALRAVAFFHAAGLEKTKVAFTDGRKDWLLGPDQFNLHVAGMSKDHMVWGDTGFPEVNGTSLDDLADFDGLSVGKTVFDALAVSPAGAAVQLRFNDPATKVVAHSEGYCLPADGANVICAWSESK
jgi:hypothetical protein